MEYKYGSDKMEYLFDLHTHSLASGHGYSTIREMAYAAKQKGLQILGITEHGLAMPGTCQDFYFTNLKVVPRMMCGVRLLLGVEANIMDYSGALDMPEEYLKQMDLVIASLHVPCLKPGTREQNTQAYIGAMKNPYVNVIGHPDDRRYPVDYEQLVLAARDHHVLLECNNGSLSPNGARKDSWAQDAEMLSYCEKYNVPVVVDSDAHIDELVGNVELMCRKLEEIRFPKRLIINSSVETLYTYLKKR